MKTVYEIKPITVFEVIEKDVDEEGNIQNELRCIRVDTEEEAKDYIETRKEYYKKIGL